MGNIKVDLKELKKFAKNLEKARDSKIKKMLESITNEIAVRLMRSAVKLTPVQEGILRNTWTVSAVNKTGDGYEVVVSNHMEYAAYVEYGHRQTPGRFVPKIGKRLKKSWVEGKFMLTKSELSMKDKLDSIVSKKVEKWLKEVFG